MMKNAPPKIHVARMMSDTPPDAPKNPVEFPLPNAEPMPPSLPCWRAMMSTMSTSAQTMSRKVSRPLSMDPPWNREH